MQSQPAAGSQPSESGPDGPSSLPRTLTPAEVAARAAQEDPADALPSIADGNRRRLDRAWITVSRLGNLVGWAVVTTLLLATAVAVGLSTQQWLLSLTVWVILVALLLVRAVVWPTLAWRHAGYAVSPRGLRIQRGVLFRSIASVPRSRVQHTDVSQGPIQRHFGIATLTVYTAGTQFAAVGLPGLRKATAEAIRDFLIDDDGDDDGV